MYAFRLLAIAFLLIFSGITATAQTEIQTREQWLKANMYEKQDAIDFITTAYKIFTPVIEKNSLETGIYKRTLKLKDCELVIETYSRVQESSWKADHEFKKDIVVIELDMVTLDGNDIRPSSAENDKGLFAGSSFEYSKKIPSYSILTPVINKDDPKFAKLHYEEHLQWAYQFLIDQCKH